MRSGGAPRQPRNYGHCCTSTTRTSLCQAPSTGPSCRRNEPPPTSTPGSRLVHSHPHRRGCRHQGRHPRSCNSVRSGRRTGEVGHCDAHRRRTRWRDAGIEWAELNRPGRQRLVDGLSVLGKRYIKRVDFITAVGGHEIIPRASPCSTVAETAFGAVLQFEAPGQRIRVRRDRSDRLRRGVLTEFLLPGRCAAQHGHPVRPGPAHIRGRRRRAAGHDIRAHRGS